MRRSFSIIDVQQKSLAWFAARAGRLTGSNAGEAVSMPRDNSRISEDIDQKETEKRKDLRYKLALERVSGRSFEKEFSTKGTRDGIAREPLALYEFEKERDECIFPAGFFRHNELMTGYSPDGFCGDVDEIVDCKCFQWKEHIAALFSEKLDKDIQAQLFHGMWLTGAKLGHVVFFNPDVAPSLRLRIVTLNVKDKATKKLYDEYVGRASLFLDDTEKAVKTLVEFGQPKVEAVSA